MPRVALVCHVGLLLAVSLLFFPAATGGDVPRTSVVSWVAVGLAVVLVATEVFSGSRWTALTVLAAVITGMLFQQCGASTMLSLWAWGIAWAATVVWFAALAARARENR